MTRWLGRELVRLATTPSTSDEAFARARAGAAHGTVVIADTQTRGRGQKGRTWHSPPGESLYLSTILRLNVPPVAAPPLTLTAGVAVCDAVNETGARSSIKWPNDVLIDGRKVAGILTETSTRGDRLEVVVLGIGVNLDATAFPPELLDIATSLRLALGRPVDHEAFLASLLRNLEARIDQFLADGAPPIVRAWKERTEILGRRVRVQAEGRIVEGIARDVDDEGALWLEGDEGRRLRVLSGEVTLEGTHER